ncbi:MAG TPA: tRNA lysidine(34) synthetase TilS [Sphingomicrobium sp.]|nr:tRNA lysidine(34) synthetase TilS [Sphingomicrobium sp.]
MLAPPPRLTERFASELDRLVPADTRLGVAVSGGPDSVALLLLAAAARPGLVEAATVDHRLRPDSADEAAAVATLCAELDVPHATLGAQWDAQPDSAIQERARVERYRLLGEWVRERQLGALATGHHLDDQAETFLMRLRRGAGVRGLAAMRPVARLPGGAARLVRPLLGWSREELGSVCSNAGVTPAADPSNADERFERVRIRRALASADWLDASAIARTAANLGAADAALDWAAKREWDDAVHRDGGRITYKPADSPLEIRRRVAMRAVESLASEGQRVPLGGREVDQLLAAMGSGATATLRGVRCSGGEVWSFEPAPPRRPA